jgi:hypothetical protein
MRIRSRGYGPAIVQGRDDGALFLGLARGEFTISGVRNKALRARFPQYNSGQKYRILRRLRTHGLIKKASHCYKYYLQTGCRTGPQTQGTGHHSGACGCPSSLKYSANFSKNLTT